MGNEALHVDPWNVTETPWASMSSWTPRSQTRREPTQRSSADESRTFLNCAPRKGFWHGQIDDLIVHAHSVCKYLAKYCNIVKIVMACARKRVGWTGRGPCPPTISVALAQAAQKVCTVQNSAKRCKKHVCSALLDAWPAQRKRKFRLSDLQWAIIQRAVEIRNHQSATHQR